MTDEALPTTLSADLEMPLAQVRAAIDSMREHRAATAPTNPSAADLEDDVLDVLILIEARAMEREGEVDDEIVADEDVDQSLGHSRID